MGKIVSSVAAISMQYADGARHLFCGGALRNGARHLFTSLSELRKVEERIIRRWGL
jgi:hypothetical protein